MYYCSRAETATNLTFEYRLYDSRRFMRLFFPLDLVCLRSTGSLIIRTSRIMSAIAWRTLSLYEQRIIPLTRMEGYGLQTSPNVADTDLPRRLGKPQVVGSKRRRISPILRAFTTNAKTARVCNDRRFQGSLHQSSGLRTDYDAIDSSTTRSRGYCIHASESVRETQRDIQSLLRTRINGCV
ncbi:uncharacterized protein [Venturia canescens]|uniref:uncharacterized protein n=1 Tax=Venturia canescens TaxID=32260 RepID=UPI001C9D56A0|nr:uncharacterized protein LOC122410500 [Venturia canescens]